MSHEMPCGADPHMVTLLMDGICAALDTIVVPEVTTDADIVAATYLMFRSMLVKAQEYSEPEDVETNQKEISRLLTALIFEFGSTPLTLH